MDHTYAVAKKGGTAVIALMTLMNAEITASVYMAESVKISPEVIPVSVRETGTGVIVNMI